MYVEDLPALIYIHHRITGIEIGQKFHHVVIDEAQDFPPFQVYVLKITLGNSFTILVIYLKQFMIIKELKIGVLLKVFQETGYYELTKLSFYKRNYRERNN